jgi:predicted permease
MKELMPLFLPIYLPIVLGFLVRLTGYFPEEFGHAIRQFCLKITIPLLIFMSMVTMDSSAVSQVLPMVLSLPLYLGILWLAALLATMLPVFRTRRIEGILVIVLGNIGYFGWAVTNLGLGPEALTRNLMFTTLFWPMIILFSILSRIAVDRTLDGVRSALKTLKVAMPMLLAFIAGLAMKLAGLTVPPVLADSLMAFSRMTVPLILFGAGLSVVFRTHWGILSLLLPLRLLLGLGAAWLTTRILSSLDPISRSVILIVSQMPVAANTLIMGDVMGLDEEFISGAITLSAVLALATIPLTLYLFA